MGCWAWPLLRLLLSIIIVCAGLAAPTVRAADPAGADPDQGGVTGRVYANPYFGLRYPLPPGWTASSQPPPPSDDGYYVLSTPTPPPGAGATILIAAQDAFFAPPPLADAGDMARALRHTVSTGGAGAASGPTTIAGQPFVRVELPGAPLSRIVFATDIRCHVVVFTFTGGDTERLKRLAMSLERLSFERDRPVPDCVRGYATPQTIEHKTAPVSLRPQFAKIAVRIVIGPDGGVEHIHIIRAVSPAQRKSIEDALRQWRFAPYRASGRAATVETGVSFDFKPSASLPDTGSPGPVPGRLHEPRP